MMIAIHNDISVTMIAIATFRMVVWQERIRLALIADGHCVGGVCARPALSRQLASLGNAWPG